MILPVLLLLSGNFLTAQVANYAFSQNSGTYNVLGASTTVIASNWDDAIATAAIPFTFNFNNINYNACSVNSNGYITFGATNSATTGYTPISANTGYAGAISAVGSDLGSNGSGIATATIGAAPNRIFVIQWTNARRYNGATLRNNDFDFQIRLSETSNLIQVVYGSCATTYGTNINVQVGLRGATNADYNNRATANNWPASTAGGTNNAFCTTSPSSLPTNGLTYTWTPKPVITGPAIACQGSTITINGYNFNNTTAVSFNGIPASSFTVVNANQITATIPPTATSGNISVTTAPGTGTFPITINVPSPIAAISGSNNVCVSGLTNLSDTTPGGTWSSASPLIASVNSSGVVTGIASGTSLITYTVVSGACTNSVNLTMTVNALPIVSGPASVCVGNTIQLSPSTGGSWTSSNSNASVDNSGLVTGLIVGNVTFTYTNSTTNCSKTTASIAVNDAPIITSQPVVQSVCSGTLASFNFGVSGAGLTYQWYNGATTLANSGTISGANSATLNINNVTLADASSDYYCVATGSCSPPVTSNHIALNVTQRVSITSQPAISQSLCTGNSASFSVTATGAGISYQWYNGATALIDSAVISGATTQTLTINPIVSGDASANYYCTVSGTAPCNPVNSNNSALIVNNGPGFSSQPAITQTICAGASISISVVATGGSLTYQWYKGVSMLTDAGSISGASTPTLTINPTVPTDSATDYYCMISNGCVIPSNSNNSELIVNEKPYISSYTTSACSATAFLVNPTTGIPTVATVVPSGTTYSWSMPVVTGGITGASAQNNQAFISQTLVNPTNSAQTATYIVTPVSGTAGNCVGANFTITVTVNPLPFAINQSLGICSGGNQVIAPVNGGGNIIPTGTTYTWNVPTVTGGMTGGAGGIAQNSINFTLTNPTNAVQTANYNVTATSGSCSGSTFTIAVSVNPKPTVAGSIATQTICSGAAIANINMSNPNAIPGTITYSWTRNNTTNLTGMPAAGSGSPISGNLTNTTNTAQTTTFTLYATSDQSCPSDPVTVDVTVSPNPTVAASPSTQTTCSGIAFSAVTLSNPNSIPGTTFSWVRDNTTNLTGIATSGTSANISGTLTNNTAVQQTTTFTVTATSNSCGTNTTTFVIIVNPRPDVAVSLTTQTLCGSTAITPIVISNPNAVPGTTFSWTRNNTTNLTGIPNLGSGSPIIGTFINNTNSDQIATFTITATAVGCPSTTTTSDVIVNPAPLAVANPAAQSVCNSIVIAPINFSTSNNLAGTTFTWTRDNTANLTGIASSGSGPISGTLTNNQNTTQTTTFTIIASAPNGCSKTITATVTVYATFTTPVIGASQTVCALSTPGTLTMTTPVTGGSGAFFYQWQRSSASSGPWTNIGGATNSTYTPPFVNFGGASYYYQLIVTSACAPFSFTSNFVYIQIINNVGFTFNVSNVPATAICSGTTFTPSISSVHVSDSAVRFDWTSDSNYISPATGTNAGTTGGAFFFGILRTSTANFSFTATNNTNASVTTQILVTPSVYDYPGPPTGAFNCSITPQILTVTILPKPTVIATVPNTLICSGYSAGIVLNGNITDAAMNFGWTRNTNANVTSTQGTGNSGSIPTGGTYTIPDVLTNTSASNQVVVYTITPMAGTCPGTPITVTITVSPQLTPGVVAANQVLCNGSDPVAFTQTTPATGGGTLTYQWQSGLTATGPWTDISGATATVYDSGILTQTTYFRRTVFSTVSGILCSTVTTTPISVTINAITPGTVAGNQNVCSGGDPVVFTVPTAATGSGALTYQWQSNTLGCGGSWTSIALNGNSATYDPPAGLLVTTYYRRIAISTLGGNPCSDYSNCITVTVNAVTGGTVGSDEVLCGNNPAAFTEITPATGLGILSYQWQSNTTGCGGSWVDIAGATGITYDAPAGVVTTTYYRRVTTSTYNTLQCTANSNCITVTANAVTSGAIDGNRTVCLGGDPNAFTSLSPGTGSGLTYQWQISTVSGSGPWTDIALATAATYDAPGPINQVTYFQRLATATINGNSCSAASNFLTVFVNNVTPSTVSAGNQTFCGSYDPNAFTVVTSATGTNAPTYQWQSSTTGCGGIFSNIVGATLANYNPPVITQTTWYHVIATSTLNGTACSATSNCVVVTGYSMVWNGSVSTDWNTANNWTPNGIPTAVNCVVIPNTTIKPYILGANYVAYAYSLTILNGGSLEVIPTNSITVTDVVNVNSGGLFLIKNNSSLVQINNVANIGNINMERTTQPMYRYDYTYWGSPVTLASNFTLGGISPNTQPDKYYSWNPTTAGGNGNWIQNSAATVINPNRGYIIRAPQTYSMSPAVTQAYTANFIGVPNNGNISIPIAIGTQPAGLFNDKLNLIGNPYPSAVNADLFLNDATNVNLIDGTIYFWTHHSPPSAANPNPFYGNYTYNYTAGDYATYTTFGGTNTVPMGYGGPIPNGFIAAGQSFFVKGLANGNAVFTNAMRDRGNNGAFFRLSENNEKHRIWLNLANEQGGFSQALVGYADGATLNYDRGFDGSAFSGNFVSFYSIEPDDQILTVQARPMPFDNADIIPLGFHANAANNYTIGIDHLDGLFETQNVYLEDKLLQVIADIKQTPYAFASEAGTFNDRFVLRYTNATLAVSNPDALSVGLVAFINDQKIEIQASENIKSVAIYDLTGKLIKTYIPAETKKTFVSDFTFAEGIYIAKTKLENGAIVTSKLMNAQ